MLAATWNVNSLTARLDFTLDFLATHQPDVVCVQELKLDDDAFPHLALAQAGYLALTHGQPQWNGVGIFVKRSYDAAPRVLARGLPGATELGARLLTAEVAGASVTSVYVPNGKSLSHPDFHTKLAFLDSLDAYVGTLDLSRPTLVAGDFNLVPGALDSWNEDGFRGRIFHTEEERSRWRRLLGRGLVDVFRRLNPTEVAFSWWDYRAGSFHKEQGLRIDFVLASPGLSELATRAFIDRDFRKKREGRIPSDHAPVLVEFGKT
jgi:exodeoxyribonuclease-3